MMPAGDCLVCSYICNLMIITLTAPTQNEIPAHKNVLLQFGFGLSVMRDLVDDHISYCFLLTLLQINFIIPELKQFQKQKK